MSLLKKIDAFINFSKQRNFDESAESPAPVDMDAVIKAKQAAKAKRDAGEVEPEVVKEEPAVAEPEVPMGEEITKAYKESIAGFKPTKMDGRQKTVTFKDPEPEPEPEAPKVAKGEDEIDLDNEEAALDNIEVNHELASVDPNDDPDRETEGQDEEVTSEEGETSGEGAAYAAYRNKLNTLESNDTANAAGAAMANARGNRGLASAGEGEEQPSWINGGVVKAGDGKNYNIIRGSDGAYYIKGSKEKVLDADGTPTKKYKTLGTALVTGRSVKDILHENYAKKQGKYKPNGKVSVNEKDVKVERA